MEMTDDWKLKRARWKARCGSTFEYGSKYDGGDEPNEEENDVTLKISHG